jgi:peptidoglycan/xylan/chitin deacetylase (PgdA/CDA1 family)
MKTIEPNFVNTYKELEGNSLRSVSRHIWYSLLSTASEFSKLTENGLGKFRVHFLYYHYVFQDEEENFRKLIESLMDTGHRIISYSEAVNRVIHGEFDRPYVCFSFDDGLHNCLSASKILNEFNISGCFFLNSMILDEKDPGEIARYCDERLEMKAARFLSWSDAEELVRLGHEVGGHTYSHVDLGQVNRSDIEDEIGKDQSILTSRLGSIKHFAWPYGKFKHLSADARDAVFDFGYESCASAIEGAHSVKAEHSRFCIRRESLLAAWPVQHSLYRIARSAHGSDESSNSWVGYPDH